MINKRNSLRLRFGRWWLPIPRFVWQRMLAKNARDTRRQVSLLGTDQHRVRDFIVEEMARVGRSLPVGIIADRLDMSKTEVEHILDELERRKTFLHRNRVGDVEWAYPVTSSPTPHRATFSSGEKTWAA